MIKLFKIEMKQNQINQQPLIVSLSISAIMQIHGQQSDFILL
jgi:hypothetical protein